MVGTLGIRQWLVPSEEHQLPRVRISSFSPNNNQPQLEEEEQVVASSREQQHQVSKLLEEVDLQVGTVGEVAIDKELEDCAAEQALVAALDG